VRSWRKAGDLRWVEESWERDDAEETSQLDAFFERKIDLDAIKDTRGELLTFFLFKLLGNDLSRAFASTLNKACHPSSSPGPAEACLGLQAPRASPKRSRRPSEGTRRRGRTLSAVEATSAKRRAVEDELEGREVSCRRKEVRRRRVEGGRGAEWEDEEVGRRRLRRDQWEEERRGPGVL